MAAALKPMKIKVKPVTAMPEPVEDEPEKKAQELTTVEPSAAAQVDEGESQKDGYREDGECPNLTNKIALA